MSDLAVIQTGPARCRQDGAHPEDWFPRPGATGVEAKAKRVCNGWPTTDPCQLRDACREYGIRNGVSGIWGGMSEDERKAERRKRGIVPLSIVTNPQRRQAAAS